MIPQATSTDEALDGAPKPLAARVGLWVGPAIALAVLVAPFPEAVPEAAVRILALAALMATWWLTEALPLPVTALAPIVAVPFAGVEVGVGDGGRLICAAALCAPEGVAAARTLNLGDLGASYAHPIVLLYIGGFCLGLAIEKCGLSSRLAYGVVAQAGDRPGLMLAGFLVAAAFLSMWISNTSTSLILTPLAMSVAAGAGAGAGQARFAAALALGVAYAATLGGLATPIGTPTNGIALAQLRNQGIDIGFGQWMAFALPIVLLLLPVAWLILARGIQVDAAGAAAAQRKVREALTALGAMRAAEVRVALIFAATAIAWATSSLTATHVFAGAINSSHLDVVIATVAAFALFAAPAGQDARGGLLDWNDTMRLPWGVLLLFGGGIALATSAELSGLTAWLAQGLTGVADLHPLLVILIVGAIVILITEFASNIATISLMGPVLLSLAAASGMDSPAAFVAPAALAASMGFAMPVGSASNAIAYGTGRVPLGAMIRRGVTMNVAALVVIAAFGYLVAPSAFPAG